jgi:hypothetical protein
LNTFPVDWIKQNTKISNLEDNVNVLGHSDEDKEKRARH